MRESNTCVCCGEIIPEGTMVCGNCKLSEAASDKSSDWVKDFYRELSEVLCYERA